MKTDFNELQQTRLPILQRHLSMYELIAPKPLVILVFAKR